MKTEYKLLLSKLQSERELLKTGGNISAQIGLLNYLYSPKNKQRRVFSFFYSNKERMY